MVSFARTAALLLLLAPSVSAFTPPKTSTSANVAAGSSSSRSPPKAISIPVDEPTTTSAPWDRISKGQQDTTTSGGRDDWVQNLDYEAFAKDVTALGKELQKSSGPDDVEHLNKVSYITTHMTCHM